MKKQDIRVFVCVPGVGKTYLCNKDGRFVDMDHLKAEFKYALENVTEAEMEWLKGNRGKPVRDDSTQYIKDLTHKYLAETDRILLYAPNPLIVEMLYEEKIPYCLVYHSKDCVEEYRERMRARGNQENFINSMLDPIDSFYEASVTDTRPAYKIELFQKEYLSDKIYDFLKGE